MKNNKLRKGRRLLLISLLIVAIISGQGLTVFANSPESSDKKIIVYNQEENTISENELDNGTNSISNFVPSSDEDLDISPLANSTTMNKVSSTTVEPYKNICYVEATFPNGTIYRSSGVLVHYNILLTSGHGVYKSECGGFADTVTVYPGFYTDSNGYLNAPFGSAKSTSIRMTSGYVNNKKVEYDWALVDLDKRFDSFQAFGYAPNYSALTGRTVTAYGYPEKYGRNMYYITGPIKESFEKLLHISIETLAGQSGGPIIDQNTGAVIGIVQGIQPGLFGSVQHNISVRIDEFLYNLINEHKAEMQ